MGPAEKALLKEAKNDGAPKNIMVTGQHKYMFDIQFETNKSRWFIRVGGDADNIYRFNPHGGWNQWKSAEIRIIQKLRTTEMNSTQEKLIEEAKSDGIPKNIRIKDYHEFVFTIEFETTNNKWCICVGGEADYLFRFNPLGGWNEWKKSELRIESIKRLNRNYPWINKNKLFLFRVRI